MHEEDNIKLLEKMKTDETNAPWYRSLLIEKNIPLVRTVLKKYKPYTEDQLQIGCIGLILAVDSYDDKHEVPFANYCCFMIERELHKAYAQNKNTIENILRGNFIFLDEKNSLDNGDSVGIEETIPDILAEDALNDIISQNYLSTFFEDIIIPCLQQVVKDVNKSGRSKFDGDLWIKCEMNYLISMSQESSQKARLNYTQMAKLLKLSVQNIKIKHNQAIEKIRQECLRRNFIVC